MVRVPIPAGAGVFGVLLALVIADPSVLAGQQDIPDDVPFATHDLPGPRHRDVLIPAGTSVELPRVAANDNRTSAGSVEGQVRIVELEVRMSDWRVEGPDGPGLRVAAIGEAGGAPRIPAPLVRAEEGMRIRATVHNRLDAPLSVFGLHDRPGEPDEHFIVPAGESVTVEFDAGSAGTYLYHMWAGALPAGDDPTVFVPEREQLAGALVVDPPGGGEGEDRILVINVFGEPVAAEVHPNGYLEGVTINGHSWPYTELIEMEVGRTERWRVVNATVRPHPMHLHGFYYDVLSKGGTATDSIYVPEQVRSVVTELMQGGTTMVMEWTPTRPGRWVFHCHLTFHVAHHIRLPGAREADPEHADSHMAGLVMGIDVAPGPSDLRFEGEPRSIDLHAKVFGGDDGYEFGFSRTGGPPEAGEADVPGPLLIFRQYEAVDVTVHNDLDEPTGVHWHGLELDAWADGVPNWSASDGRISPAIPPGESFTYRLALMRPGTFMYHTHLNDLEQLSGGLYGPLLVLPRGEEFDPRHDHVRIFGWPLTAPESPADFELNGRSGDPPGVETTVGSTHRFRIMNIMPAGQVSAWVFREDEPVALTLIAKDGADLPTAQRTTSTEFTRIGAGETMDLEWTPTEPGTFRVLMGVAPEPGLAKVQTWVVRAADEGRRP